MIHLEASQTPAPTTAQAGLLHIVLWQLHGETAQARQAKAQQLSHSFHALLGTVPGLLQVDVGPNAVAAADAWDMAVAMRFTNRAALDAYNEHPLHLGIKALMGPQRRARAQIDLALGAQAHVQETA